MGIKRLRCSATHSGISDKNWKRTGIENLLRKLQETGSLDHLMRIGRRRQIAQLCGAAWSSR